MSSGEREGEGEVEGEKVREVDASKKPNWGGREGEGWRERKREPSRSV